MLSYIICFHYFFVHHVSWKGLLCEQRGPGGYFLPFQDWFELCSHFLMLERVDAISVMLHRKCAVV